MVSAPMKFAVNAQKGKIFRIEIRCFWMFRRYWF